MTVQTDQRQLAAATRPAPARRRASRQRRGRLSVATATVLALGLGLLGATAPATAQASGPEGAWSTIGGRWCAQPPGVAGLGPSCGPWVSEAPSFSYRLHAQGVAYISPAGTNTVAGVVDALHRSVGGGSSPAMGYPTGRQVQQAPRFAYQTFERGVAYSGPAGSYLVTGEMNTLHRVLGGGGGTLGYPRTNLISEGGRYQFQSFERGAVYASAFGRHTVTGDIAAEHRRLGGGSGSLGYPTATFVQQASGYGYQVFERGVVYSSRAGTFSVLGAIGTEHRRLGGGSGSLGYPLTPYTVQVPGAYGYQAFERGVVYVSGAGTYGVVGAANTEHRRLGGGSGILGYPTSTAGTNSAQSFERGVIRSARTGAFAYAAENVNRSSAVLICDSQCAGHSWSEQGAEKAGFTHIVKRAYGGGGYVAPGGDGLGVSLTEGIAGGKVLLPQGDPGLVMVTLGGNDSWYADSDQVIVDNLRRLVREVRLRYPDTQIVVNGVMSRSSSDHQRRRQVDALVTAEAARLGLVSISVAGWGDGVASLYDDGVHLSQAGHDQMGTFYGQTLRRALGAAG